MIAYLHRTYPHRRTSKQHISNLQGAETADVGNNLVYGEQHVARISLLYRLSIDIQMEIHVLNVAYFFHRHPIADGCRVVKSFAQLPASRGP